MRTALEEAKETLEQRVLERTGELREQIEAKDRAHAELAAAQQRLITLSREAGMAEIATGVLHNVGNVLNSVNVSTTLLAGRIRESRVDNLIALIGMLEQHSGDLPEFLGRDPKGRRARLAAKPFPHPAMTQWQQMESVSHAGDRGSLASGRPVIGQSETNMRIVITLLCASCCFGQGQGNAAATGIGGESALKRKAIPRTLSALALDRWPARDTWDVPSFAALASGNISTATAGIIDLGGLG